jgi:hypothetical protein
MIRNLLTLILITSAGASEFSVYLTPPELSENGKPLASVSDICIDVNGTAIPLALVEGRQSITYPCVAGENIQFFRVSKDEKQIRTVIVSSAVPASAEQGLLVVSSGAEGGCKIVPFWFSSAEARKGSGVFVNLSSRTLGVVCNGQRTKLLPQSRMIVAGRFSSGERLVPTRVEIFGQTAADSVEITRLIDRRVGIPQDDTGIYFILPKQDNFITLLSLEGGGLRDPIAKEALKKQLPPDSKAEVGVVPAPVG